MRFDKKRGIIVADYERIINVDFINDALKLFMTDSKYGAPHFKKLGDVYDGEFALISDSRRDRSSPELADNRIVMNWAKIMVQTFNSYMMGNGLTVYLEDEAKNEQINSFVLRSKLNSVIANVAKSSSIYGVSSVVIYNDEEANVRVRELMPETSFIVYDNTLNRNMMCAIEYDIDETTNNIILYCTTDTEVITLGGTSDSPIIKSRENHNFPVIPIVEFKENVERHGLFETQIPAIEAYSRVLSSKVNSIEDFNASYMVFGGAYFDAKDFDTIHKERVIYPKRPIDQNGNVLTSVMENNPKPELNVDFVTPKQNDQEFTALKTLRQNIFQTASVVDVSNEDLNMSPSGLSLELRMQPMASKASDKIVVFDDALRDMFHKISTRASNGVIDEADIYDLNVKFNPKVPRDTVAEVANAVQLEGIVSKETQLSTLSFVPNPVLELSKINDERQRELDNMMGGV